LADQQIELTVTGRQREIHDELGHGQGVQGEGRARLPEASPWSPDIEYSLADWTEAVAVGGRPGPHPTDPALSPDEQSMPSQPIQTATTSPSCRRLAVMFVAWEVQGLELASAHQPQVGNLSDNGEVTSG
jgi:hypothetical protein